MENRYQIVLCTCPDSATAEQIAGQLVDQSLAACVNILPGIRSIYRWQGKRETTEETLLIIKTRQHVYPRLEQTLQMIHPYDVPEIIAASIDQGLPEYLGWIDENLQPAFESD